LQIYSSYYYTLRFIASALCPHHHNIYASCIILLPNHIEFTIGETDVIKNSIGVLVAEGGGINIEILLLQYDNWSLCVCF